MVTLKELLELSAKIEAIGGKVSILDDGVMIFGVLGIGSQKMGLISAAENMRAAVLCWNDVANALPPDGLVVETKIDDAKGCRNVQILKRQGRLWFFPDGSMYVYYDPTHWRLA